MLQVASYNNKPKITYLFLRSIIVNSKNRCITYEKANCWFIQAPSREPRNIHGVKRTGQPRHQPPMQSVKAEVRLMFLHTLSRSSHNQVSTVSKRAGSSHLHNQRDGAVDDQLLPLRYSRMYSYMHNMFVQISTHHTFDPEYWILSSFSS